MAKKRVHHRAAKKTGQKKPAKIGALSKKIKSLTAQKHKLERKHALEMQMKRAKAALKKLK